MIIGQEFREARAALAVSQSALARAAGVSLATVQNIEAGRANPALATLRRLSSALGLELRLHPAPADWPALIALGLPLAGAPGALAVRDADALRMHVGRAAAELAAQPSKEHASRLREALTALVVAAVTHYPDATRGWLENAPAVRSLVPDAVPGRILKLARVATRRLAEYL